jgi:two-component sensor histidine kinase
MDTPISLAHDYTTRFATVELIVSGTTVTQEMEYSVSASVPLAPREAEDDRFLLLREMHHRLANILTVLASAIRHEFAASVSHDVSQSLARCEARIVAFGKLNRTLAVGAIGKRISLRCYVERLCEALSEALLGPFGIRCEVFVDAAEFPAEQCERLGLVISELVMNAAKHGFHGRKDGGVRVEIQKESGSWVCIVVDNGVGTKSAPTGIGSKIVEQLVAAIGGTVVQSSGPDGTVVIVTWKI